MTPNTGRRKLLIPSLGERQMIEAQNQGIQYEAIIHHMPVIRVREENSQCNYQAVDAQRFPERKTQDLEPLEFSHQD